MRVTISNIAWAPEDDAEIARLIVAGGGNGVELAPTKYWPAPCRPTDAELAHKRRFWEDAGLPVTSLQALLFGMVDLSIFGDAKSAEETLNYLEHIAHIGAALGAKRLVFGSPRNRDRGDLPYNEAFARAVAFFRRLSERIAALDVTFVLEPNPTQYACNFATTALQARDLVRAVNHPKFALHLDAGIMLLNEECPEATVADCEPDLVHVHISEPYLAPVKDDSKHHAALAKALRGMAYKGFLSIEMRSQNDPALDRLAVTQALAQVRKVYQGLES